MSEILELAREVSDYTICGEGNVSIRDGNNFKIKASGTSLHTLSEEDLTLCDIYGKQLDETHKKPLALGIATLDSNELRQAKKGKIIKNLHWIGDDLWNMQI